MKTKLKLLQDDLYNYVSKFNRASRLTAAALCAEEPQKADRAALQQGQAEPLFPPILQPFLTPLCSLHSIGKKDRSAVLLCVWHWVDETSSPFSP